MTNNILDYWNTGDGDPFEPLFATAPIMLHSIDREGKILKVSAFEAMKLGYQPKEMIGRPSTDFLTPESRDYALNVVLPEYFREGAIYNVPYDFVRKDGEILPVMLSATAEYDENGDFRRSLAVLFDNTIAKRAQREAAESERLEMIGRLVGGVAHDFNNLLAVIQGNLDLHRMNANEPKARKYLASAYQATVDGAKITGKLLAFGQKSFLSPEDVDLNELISRMGPIIDGVAPENIEVTTITRAAAPPVRIDRRLLEISIDHLARNAQDAMRDGGGVLTLEVSTAEIEDDLSLVPKAALQPGRYVTLSVIDTGVGMTAKTLGEIFDPYFTTKGVGHGGGLSLAMVYGFIKQSGGSITAYSEPGAGTTVVLYLPIAAARAGEDQPAPDEADGPSDVAVLDALLVDNDVAARQAVAEAAAAAGLRIRQASSGDNAYSLMRSGYRPHILISGVVMPGSLQGPALAKLMRRKIPGLRVILLSSFPREAALYGEAIEQSDLRFVKPIDETVLKQALSIMIADLRRK